MTSIQNVATLASKAVKAKLYQPTLNVNRKESQLTEEIQRENNDKSLSVMAKLFNDKNNPVYTAIKITQALYQYHIKNTLPYEDAGPRLLPNSKYMDYMAGIQEFRNQLDKWRDQHLANYDQYIEQDIAYRRSKGKGISAIDPSDYPSAGRLLQMLEPTILVEPLPDQAHFLFDISDADRQNFEAVQEERMRAAQADAVARIALPLEKLIAKLEKFAGAKGERFHESLVSNIIEGALSAKDLTLEATPEYLDQLDEIAQEANKLSVEGLRENEHYRKDTKEKLDKMAKKLSMFGPSI